MKIFLHPGIHAVLCYLAFPVIGYTQASVDTAAPAVHRVSQVKGLFETDKVLEITLSCNRGELIFDRSENSQYHPMLLLYREDDSSEIAIPAKAKTRGHFRKLKGNCLYPPLLINFSKTEALKSSIFKGQDKLKLVMPCQGDKYVIREWLVYKLYNLVTPKSFRTRLVSIKLNDTKNKKTSSPFYGILLEEEKQMAKRNGAVVVKRKTNPDKAEQEAFLTMAVFQYLSGNTDWSCQYLHNIKLLAPDSNSVCTPVPYDFDHAGLVNAPYAKPPEELNLGTVLERRYRGYCVEDIKKFEGVIALFNRLKKDIYKTYNDCPLLDAKYKKATLKYLDQFYTTINNPASVKEEFGYPCYEYGKANVIIRGLTED